MGKTAVLAIKFVADAVDARKGLREVDEGVAASETRFERFNSKMGQAAIPAAAFGGALVGLGKQAAESASALQQSTGAVESVFGAQASVMQGYADQAAQNLGLAKSDYLQMSAIVGTQLKNMGVPTEQLTGQTNDLMGMAADLAATFGGPTSDAVDALSSLLKGERDPIERYGVSMKQADIDAKKAAMGLAGLTGEADKQATTQATLALLTDQTTAAQGAFAREANTAEGAQQRATAEWENAKAALGEALLPTISAAAQELAKLSKFASEHADIITPLALIIGGIAGAVLAYNAATAAVPAVVAVATAAQWLWNAAMSANPLGLIVLGIAAVIAIIVVMIRHWDDVKRVALGVWGAIEHAAGDAADWVGRQADRMVQWIINGWNSLLGGVGHVRDWIVDAFRSAWNSAGDAFWSFVNPVIGGLRNLRDWVSDVIGKIRQIGFPSPPSWMSNLLHLSAAAPAAGGGVPIGSLTAAATTAIPLATITTASSDRATPAGNVVINVNGALDPRAVARQIRDILNSDARIAGRVAVNGGAI